MLISIEDLVENIGEGYLEMDADLRVVEMNENAEILLRKNREGAAGKALSEIIPDAGTSQHWPALLSAIESRTYQTLSVFYPVQYKWHEYRIIPLRFQHTGLLFRDVTNRQWLIRREAERVYLKNIFEDAPVALLLLRGRDLEIEYMNSLARQLVGNRQIMGLPIRKAFPDLEQRELFDTIDEVYRRGIPFSSRDVFVQYDRDGDGMLEEAYFDVMYQPVGDFDGTVSGVLSLSVDVTDRKRLEKSILQNSSDTSL